MLGWRSKWEEESNISGEEQTEKNQRREIQNKGWSRKKRGRGNKDIKGRVTEEEREGEKEGRRTRNREGGG